MSSDITALAQRTDLLIENALETANQLRELQESEPSSGAYRRETCNRSTYREERQNPLDYFRKKLTEVAP